MAALTDECFLQEGEITPTSKERMKEAMQRRQTDGLSMVAKEIIRDYANEVEIPNIDFQTTSAATIPWLSTILVFGGGAGGMSQLMSVEQCSNTSLRDLGQPEQKSTRVAAPSHPAACMYF